MKRAEIFLVIAGVISTLLSAQTVFAAPAVSSVSGMLTHKATITINGSGFGIKNPAAPLVWDDASGSNILDKWSGAWPVTTDPIGYRTPIRGVDLPHNNIAKYIAGAHSGPGTTFNATNGPSVVMWKYYTVSGYPHPVFHSYYYKVDPNWVFTGSGNCDNPHDNNCKLFSHSDANGPYSGNSYYYEHRSPDFTATSNPGIYAPYIATSVVQHTFLREGSNPKNEWLKMEMEARYTNQSDGYIKIWRNGVQGTTFNGSTDYNTNFPSGRTEAIGGYARCYNNPTNWRYFADVYLDTSWARIVLANSPNLSTATIKEMQIPSAWTNGSIAATVNLGRFTAGQTAYLFVFDPNGTSNANGYPIIIGGGAPAPTSCNTVTPANFSQAAYNSYGAPFDAFQTSTNLIDAKCTSADTHTINLTTGVTGDTTRIVYTKGYWYDAVTTAWRQYTGTCTGALNGEWCQGSVSATITDANVSTASSTNPTYLVGMTCSVQGGSWKCGCRDTSCTNFSWQIQGAGL